jgi:hypothetical protein
MKKNETVIGTDLNWAKSEAEDFFSDKKLQQYITESRNNPDPERIYAHLSMLRVDESLAQKNDELYKALKKKDASLKKIAAQMKKALQRKNKKLTKLLRYISILEDMLNENGIDYKTIKRKIKDSEVKLSSRKMQGEITEEDENIDEYIEAVEIELDDEGNEINLDD